MTEICIFCKIALKEAPAHIIWEDDKHIAFLSIFPNTEGFTVVIPKKHYSSYTFDLPDVVLSELVIASKKVAKLLDDSFTDVARTGLVMEGYGVDHVHTKLIPMHGTAKHKEWKPVHVFQDKYFSEYEGYLSSHDCHRADDETLKKLSLHIRNTKV